MQKTYGSNADTAYADWQDRADHNPDDDRDGREMRRIQVESVQWWAARNRMALRARNSAPLGGDPWAL